MYTLYICTCIFYACYILYTHDHVETYKCTCTIYMYTPVCLIVVPPSLPPSLLVLSSFMHEHKNDIPNKGLPRTEAGMN